MPSSHLILCRPLLLLPVPPSVRVFSNESTLHMRWPKYWSFSFSISLSNEHLGTLNKFELLLMCTLMINFIFSSVQLLSHVRLFETPWTAVHRASLSITNSWSLLRLMFMQSMMPSNHLIFCHPLLLLPSIFPNIRVFSNESVLHIRWPKYWSFNFNISPSNEYSGLTSFRMDWLDHLAVQRASQESSPTPQFKSIGSSALSFLYSPTLTSIHDHWKNHSLD